MNKIVDKEYFKIEYMIYVVREKQVMLDNDLAKLYKYSQGTKALNQAVKRNIERFLSRFSWIINDQEWDNLRSIISTSSSYNKYGGR